ncbi:SPOR domain-containing protein [Pseudogemmobacter bohemicus]|uniref:SPOR domain-containing protein n=1 Tax=Pseudogemmobacter bohemicus TaxID=2250708 RepID=UPI0022B84217|nr:SPOR domain-containing protein [Pseudogemmobacter bohemicus]
MANADYGDYGGYASHARPQDYTRSNSTRSNAARPGFPEAAPLRGAEGATGQARVQPRQPLQPRAQGGSAFQVQDGNRASAAMAPALPLTRGQRMVNMAGALGSVALVLSLGYWGWELAVRDVRGVPVVKALEGPMRSAPEVGGGMVVDYQGLSVNDVAARDGGNGSDRVVLAPAPVELAADDVAGLAMVAEAPIAPGGVQGAVMAPAVAPAPAGGAEVSRMSVAEESPLPLEVTPEELPAAPAVAVESQPAIISQDEAVALALAEALGMDEAASADLVAAAAPAAPPGAMISSPRPRLRPDSLGQASPAQASMAAATAPVNVTQTAAVAPAASGAGKDPATIEVGARLVQFGAYDSEAQAQAEWQKIAAKLGPLMAEKQMVVQSAESGGLTFWRLRGFGFASEDDARRFCSAAVAEQINCIPVTQR